MESFSWPKFKQANWYKFCQMFPWKAQKLQAILKDLDYQSSLCPALFRTKPLDEEATNLERAMELLSWKLLKKRS